MLKSSNANPHGQVLDDDFGPTLVQLSSYLLLDSCRLSPFYWSDQELKGEKGKSMANKASALKGTACKIEYSR